MCGEADLLLPLHPVIGTIYPQRPCTIASPGHMREGLSLFPSAGVPRLRRPRTLYPWRWAPTLGRVRRAWVIPPISVSENHKRLPFPLVQIKSDKQQLGSVIYSIQGPGVDEEPRGVFSIDKFTGKVSLNAMLDREKTDRFRLRAFALDLGGATLEEPTDLEIVVVDQNDNRPVFRQEVFTGRVLEGAVPGTYVTRAEATDADDPETDNAALRYSILEQGGPQLFSIDPLTGEIRTVQVGLDREVVAVYNLTLQVADMSGDGLTATASAIITLEDINDNAPEFTGDQFFMEAAEAVSGVDVGRLEVEDRDLPGSPNWAARFTILEGDPDGQFTIHTDPRTNEGVLSVVKPLDYESRERYDLKVAVQNEAPLQAAAPRAERGQARVSVQVRDVNEAPVFQENPLRTSLAEGAAPGTPVATFSARDPDTQQLQRLSYSKDYDPEDWLQVDGATGRVQTQRVLSPSSPFLKDGWYRAIILARDDAPPPGPATGTLSIEILEVNDHAPELSPPWGSLCSTPDRGSGLLLGATDEDLPPHGAPFHFQLSPRVPELARNWSLSQVNVSHARLRPRLRVPEGLHPPDLAAFGAPWGRPPLRRDAPFGRARPQVTRALPTSPADIADFINDGLEAADCDPSVPPYDTALIYDYEGDGSLAGTLSSILSSLDDEDQDYSCLREWGPRFSRLADLYGPP
ncbi:PREDICTED: cadherin-15 [Bison bison bison]|uniref:Cadherin-15 n=1 Tax=Bison bison bison TaxID=43346 RepID=A0A6P3HHD6_BISBB|nr:PREDICTED: cadherin-15 [Bison bison bison]